MQNELVRSNLIKLLDKNLPKIVRFWKIQALSSLCIFVCWPFCTEQKKSLLHGHTDAAAFSSSTFLYTVAFTHEWPNKTLKQDVTP